MHEGKSGSGNTLRSNCSELEPSHGERCSKVRLVSPVGKWEMSHPMGLHRCMTLNYRTASVVQYASIFFGLFLKQCLMHKGFMVFFLYYEITFVQFSRGIIEVI